MKWALRWGPTFWEVTKLRVAYKAMPLRCRSDQPRKFNFRKARAPAQERDSLSRFEKLRENPQD